MKVAWKRALGLISFYVNWRSVGDGNRLPRHRSGVEHQFGHPRAVLLGAAE